jgi:ABC-type multidrug transport system fused ATPase/permease subunit
MLLFRNLLFSSVMRKNVAFFDKNKTGELVNRLSADSQLVSQTITQQVSDGLRSVVMTSAGVGKAGNVGRWGAITRLRRSTAVARTVSRVVASEFPLQA